MFTNSDYLQIPPSGCNIQKKSQSTDSKMSSQSDIGDDRADSGLGSLGPASFEHSGSYGSSERQNLKTDNSGKYALNISEQIQEEDDQLKQVDSGLVSLELLSCDNDSFVCADHSKRLNSMEDSFGQMSLNRFSEIQKNDFEGMCDSGLSSYTIPLNMCDPTKSSENSKSYSVIVPMEQRIKFFEGDKDGDSKLHLSILNGDQNLSFLLIKLAPHYNWLNYCNHLWQTPLHLAVLTNQSQVVRRLLCAGADATCQDKDGNTPLHIACREGYEDIVRHLLTPVRRDELCENLYDIPYQKLPQDMSIRNYEGETCLHVAVRHSHIKIVALLLASGVDINVGDGKSGRTALHIASELNNVDIIKIILYRRDAKIDVRNYAGLTPVQLAYGRGHKDSVNEICRHGNYTRADMSLQDSSDEDEDMITDSD